MSLLKFTDGKLLPTPILFTLKSIAKENDFIPASRELFVGCVRTMAVSQKKVSLLFILILIPMFVLNYVILFRKQVTSLINTNFTLFHY